MGWGLSRQNPVWTKEAWGSATCSGPSCPINLSASVSLCCSVRCSRFPEALSAPGPQPHSQSPQLHLQGVPCCSMRYSALTFPSQREHRQHSSCVSKTQESAEGSAHGLSDMKSPIAPCQLWFLGPHYCSLYWFCYCLL